MSDSHQVEVAPHPLLIPTSASSIADFVQRAQAIMNRSSSHVYFDTSFLVWLTTLGKEARREFIAWVDSLGRERFHIPVWAAHEYLTHHVRNLIGDNLTRTSKELNRLADTTYTSLRPFLDEPVQGDIRSPQELQVVTRDTLLQLKTLAERVALWKAQHYHSHFSEVAALISDIGLGSAGIFDYMSDIDALERNRFAGRIPPGFQDRGKKARAKKTDLSPEETAPNGNGPGEHPIVGSNRFGDLMFWREVLSHAGDPAIDAVVVLSNDRKNDWRMGGLSSPDVEDDLRSLRRDWDPVPIVHPMLALEARVRARVSELLVMDSAYLAAMFRKSGVSSERFVDAALGVELPRPRSLERQRRRDLITFAHTERSKSTSSMAAFDDGPEVNIGSLVLERAAITKMNSVWVASRLNEVLAANSTGQSLTDILTAASLQEASTIDLVRFGRELHGRALAGEALASSLISDLLTVLPTFPPKTASCLYLGVLMSIYFDNDNTVRIPPNALALESALRWQRQLFAAPAINILVARLNRSERRPIYAPSIQQPRISVQVLVRADLDHSPPLISGLQLNGVELITQSQGDPALQLTTLLSARNPVLVRDLVTLASTLFGFPIDQVEDEALDRMVSYDTSTGFEAGRDVYIGGGGS